MARIKESPEDFYVKEIKKLKLSNRGRFAYFLLRKRGISTLDALYRLSKELKVPLERVGVGGLKDKEAVTEQYVSVEEPRIIKDIKGKDFSLKFLGYSEEPMTLGSIEGNYFEITIRRVNSSERRRIKRGLELVRKLGFENYFGEQRFGSAKHSDRFIAKLLLEEKYEDALKEYLTSMGDRKRRKELLKLWGDWNRFIKVMPQSSHIELSIVRKLMKGASYKEALSSLPRRVKLLFAFAYQSYLWNRYLSTFVVRYFKHCSVPFLRWRLSFIKELPEHIFKELENLEIPFLGTEHKPAIKKVEIIIREVLEEENLLLEDVEAERIGIKLFTDGVRKAFVKPSDLKILEEGKTHLKLAFSLPAGSYATILVRKLLCSPV